MKKQISYQDLDTLLDRLATDPEGFEDAAREIGAAWNAEGVDLELSSPSSWRRPASVPPSPGVMSIEELLRSEIEVILPMERDEEARLARRIEFARCRLEAALETEGLTSDDLAGAVSYDPATYRSMEPAKCLLPQPVCRRWVELHALRTELVERNLYLVLINVERYAHLGVSRLDLIQEGSASLFRAVDGFDWRRGLLFRTYAVHWLNQAFRSHLYNFGQTVRVPVYLQKALKHVRAAIQRLGDPEAGFEAIAAEADLDPRLVESVLAANKRTYSVDTPLHNGEHGSALADLLGDEGSGDLYSTSMEDVSLGDGLSDALERLSDRERYVIEMRFGLNQPREHTLSEVARELGVSLERVRQIQVRAVSKMRTPALRKAVDPFL